MRPTFTLGIEEEYQTVDPETRDLRSHIATEMLAQGKLRLEERVKAEMHQSVIEVGTRICQNIQEAQEDLYDLRRNMIRLAEENGLVLVAGATHPFADWRAQEIYPDPRYDQVVEDLQLVARSNLIFGLHVHVGIEDKEAAIRIMNSLRYFLPHILALSTNSPFWLGMETGYKSYRAKVFENFPRTNMPDSFASYSEFESYVNLLIKTNCIDNAKKIWWDVRPHPFFDTVEVRVCDIPHAGGGVDRDCGADPGDGVQAVASALAQPGLPAVLAGAADGEQVPGRAVWAGWQADRLRQAVGGAGAGSDRGVPGVHRRCAG